MNSKLDATGTALLETPAAATDDAPAASAPTTPADFGVLGFTDRRSDGLVRERRISPFTSTKVARVRALADKSLEDAKALYEELFGVKHTDQSIDFALTSALSQRIATGEPFNLPDEVGLALWLQSGGRRVGRTPLPDLTPVMTRALARKREIMDAYPVGDVNHVRAPVAEQMVAQEFLAESGLRTTKRFIHVMKHRNLWNPQTRNGRTR
jgi:hypothetical protein